ncbi:metallophosphoesterase [Frigoribacterium sp. ACAM 257]|uniref:metallophosphoesterase n=1 Tax=Frigoribacterium sp. ACAM 257 TaxID=2508998 RepID=UPI0011B95989|nr:metallophosphoesterase [Frigoribacterium sp. ACAM 257]TWX34136.1 metallophosphoesterase [Frigoribacterium sp. ACAM 257]
MGLNDQGLALPTEAPPSPLIEPAEQLVAVAGDWHSSRSAARKAMRLVREYSPEIRTMLHVGDFNLGSETPWVAYRQALRDVMRESGVRRILVTPGNHDNWGRLVPYFATHPNTPYLVPRLESISFLPRGYRFEISGRTFLSFGGAASPDQEKRTPGKDWWPEEEPTQGDADLAAQAGTVDIMLAHEAVDNGTGKVDRLLQIPNSRFFTEHGLEASQRSRAIVTDVWTRTSPRVLCHGHMHVKDERRLPDGRRVFSMAAEEMPGNVGVIDLTDLSWTWLA